MTKVTRPAPCGPDACFTMSDELAAHLVRRSAVMDHGITQPSGKPVDSRYRDLGAGHAAGWQPRQQAAAARLEGLWKASLRGWTGPGGYRSGGGGPSGDTEEDLKAAGAAWKEYQDVAHQVESRCSPAHARALKMVVINHEPSPLGRAHLVREALTFLADLWRMK